MSILNAFGLLLLFASLLYGAFALYRKSLPHGQGRNGALATLSGIFFLFAAYVFFVGINSVYHVPNPLVRQYRPSGFAREVPSAPPTLSPAPATNADPEAAETELERRQDEVLRHQPGSR